MNKYNYNEQKTLMWNYRVSNLRMSAEDLNSDAMYLHSVINSIKTDIEQCSGEVDGIEHRIESACEFYHDLRKLREKIENDARELHLTDTEMQFMLCVNTNLYNLKEYFEEE